MDPARPGAREGATRRVALALALMLAVVVGSGAAVTWWEDPTEYKVKAAFLYNYAVFTTFPSTAFTEAQDPLVVAVVGEDPFGRILDATIEGKLVNGRRLTVRRFDGVESMKRGDPVHMLFVSRSEDRHLATLLRALEKRPVFVVGEQDGFTRMGGVCRLIISDDGRVRFEINIDEAERRGLSISSKLLSLARIVRDEPPPGANSEDEPAPGEGGR